MDDSLPTQGVWLAALRGDVGEVERLVGEDPGLLEAKDEEGMTPLLRASSAGQLEVVRWLLDNGAAITQTGERGNTALTYACYLDNIPLVKLLVERGPDTSTSGGVGTPLMTASIAGHSEVVRFLLEHLIVKKDINHSTKRGETVLWKACQWGHGACVTALLESGADPPRPSQSNRSLSSSESLVLPPRAAGSAWRRWM
jgi:ankyrin repeat protein